MNNLVEDIVGLLHALDFQEAIVVGHDFGSPVAASCALTRSDIFRGLCLMSAPFSGFPVRTSNDSETSNNPDQDAANIHEDLATLSRPRKHYQWYYATREANNDMMKCSQGVHSFLRAYYHHKSADWAQNTPSTLSSWTAEELAKLPTYYVMDMERTMPQTVASEMPTPKQIKDCAWLTEAELNVYSSIYSETGFQGGLQWYRCSTMGLFDKDLLSHVGKTVDIPSCFMAGKNDWGVYQRPGAFETMQEWALSDFRSCHLIHNAGHWVQQEQPKPVIDYLVKFLKTI
jgi:pimeloyl-ACP methyl ester carboxylesterase